MINFSCLITNSVDLFIRRTARKAKTAIIILSDAWYEIDTGCMNRPINNITEILLPTGALDLLR